MEGEEEKVEVEDNEFSKGKTLNVMKMRFMRDIKIAKLSKLGWSGGSKGERGHSVKSILKVSFQLVQFNQ